MFPVTILLLSVFFSLRGNSAQSVDQPDAHITVSEGASLELRCSYSYSATPSLFWYVQYPGQSLQLLLKYITGDTIVKSTNGFEAEFRKSNSSFNLKKSPAHWRDSAKYYCALRGTVHEAAGGARRKPPEIF
ncbi:rCG23345, partial [Rattus norvegicus]